MRALALLLLLVLDWRLLPDSALKNAGVLTNPPGIAAPIPTFIAQNGTAFSDSDCAELASYRWDGEGYGNPRIVDGKVDIGFDEIDSLIACGTWGNHSNSHNAPPPLLQPNALQGRATRMFIFDQDFKNRACTIHGAGAVPPTPLVAWSKPPETLSTPVVNPFATTSLPPERKTRYIGFTDSGATPTGPVGWTLSAGTMTLQTFIPPFFLNPPGSPNRRFTLAILGIDDEATVQLPPSNLPQPNLYFGYSAVLTTLSGAVWWSNLQSEYR